MPKTRLTADMRITLINHARSLIVCEPERDAENAARGPLVELARQLVEERFPDRDMKVLAKYRVALTVDAAVFRWGDGYVGEKRMEIKAPTGRAVFVPYHRSTIDLPKPHQVYELYAAWDAAVAAHKAAREVRLEDYRTLVQSVRNFEDVVAIWPEAAACATACRVRPTTNLPARLTEDVMARIKADVAARAA